MSKVSFYLKKLVLLILYSSLDKEGKKRSILLLLIIFKGVVLSRDRGNKTNGNTIGSCSRASFHFGCTKISIGTASSVKTASRSSGCFWNKEQSGISFFSLNPCFFYISVTHKRVYLLKNLFLWKHTLIFAKFLSLSRSIFLGGST